jgi:glycosyltransferase involved in cell wall biosynthesis
MVARRAGDATSPPARLFLRRESAKLAALERELCVRVQMNLCVSPLDQERLVAITGDVPVEVVENGVDVDYFEPGPAPAEGARGLIFAGGMGWYPNREAVRFLVREIWPALLAANPERQLSIIGRSPAQEVKEAAAADERIRVPGFVDDVRPYMDAAAIYVCPIQTGGGTRLKILDALAMAKPLVATRMAVEGLGLEPERHYLEAESPEDYVRQIDRLEGDPALGEALGRAGRAEVAARYAWDAVGENLRRAFERAVSD